MTTLSEFDPDPENCPACAGLRDEDLCLRHYLEAHNGD